MRLFFDFQTLCVYKEDSTAENERAYIESEDHDASFIVDVVV